MVRSLLGRGIGVRVLTRDPEKPEARELAGLGAEVASGDPADRSSIERVLDGVHGVFSERLGECRVYSGRLACRREAPLRRGRPEPRHSCTIGA